MYAPRESFCWKKIFGQEEVCSWCTIGELNKRQVLYKSQKLVSDFFDEASDCWFQSYDELVKWPDGRTVKYSISVDITEQKEIQANMIKTHTKLAIQSKKLKEVNAKLEYMAKKDYLTGIDNRGNFFTLGEELFNSSDDKREIFVVMFDLDNFKELNDKYGHKTGDNALKEFAAVVNGYLSTNDIFGRLGGEEFSLISGSGTKEDILQRVENIIKGVGKIRIESREGEIGFTVSAGIVKREDCENLDLSLERADRELYGAKDEGKKSFEVQDIKKRYIMLENKLFEALLDVIPFSAYCR